MSMVPVPSEEPGRGSQPAEIRMAHAGHTPYGHAYGHAVHNYGRDRLMAGQRTVRRASEQPLGTSGVGVVTEQPLTILPQPMPPVYIDGSSNNLTPTQALAHRIFPTLPLSVSSNAVVQLRRLRGLGAPAGIVDRIGRILQGLPPQDSERAVYNMQRWIDRKTAQFGITLPAATGMAGWNAATGQYDPDESPYDVVYADPYGGNNVDWGGIISNSTDAITDIIAISQGGSVVSTPYGGTNVYGSPGVAGQAAMGGGFGGGGIQTPFGSASGGGLAIVAIGALAVVMMMGRR